MYSKALYSTSLYGSIKGFAPVGASTRFEFNGYSLQTADQSILTTDKSDDHAPRRNLKSVTRPRTHGKTILNDTQEEKIIELKGRIKADSACELDELLDEIKKNLIVLEGNLDIKNACGTTKRYIATLINGESMFKRPGNYVTICPFIFRFACYEPFANSISYSSSALFGETSLSKDETIVVEGSFETKSVLVFVINSATSVVGLTYTNNTRGEAIEIIESLTAGDILVIDSEQKLCSLNGTTIDYNGVFPIFNVGSNSYTIDVDGSNVDYDVTLKHKITYL